MRYKLIVFDLDETLWTIQQRRLDPVRGPFQLVNSHEAVGETATVTLFRGVRALLKNLLRVHGVSCVCARHREQRPAVQCQ